MCDAQPAITEAKIDQKSWMDSESVPADDKSRSMVIVRHEEKK